MKGKVATCYGKIQYHAPWFDVRLLGSEQDLSFTKSFDFDATPLPVAFFDSSNIFTKAKSAELQIVSNSESPFSDWMEWIVGAYYFKSQQGLDPAGFHAAQIDLPQGLIAGIRVPQALTDVLSPILSSLPLPSGVDINLTGSQDTDSIAYFAQTTFHLTDWASLTLGGRYQVEDRALKESSSGVRLANGVVVPIEYYSAYADNSLLYDPNDFKDTTKQFDPKVSINIRPGGSLLGDEPLIYANWQTATTSLVYNVVNLYDWPEKVKSSDIEAYEIGFKTYLFDRLINLNVAVFDCTLKNSQAQVVSLQSGGAVRFENVPESKIRGADFDALILLFPELTDYGLVLTLGSAYLDAEYTDYPQGGGFDQVTGLYTQSNNFTGNRVVQTPKFTGSVGLTQTFRLPGGPLDVGVDYYYNDGFFMYAQNTPNSEIGSYGVLGFNVSYLYEPWKLRASVFGTNVTNEDYDVAVFLNDFGADRFPSRLAQYGVRLSWEF